MERLKLDFIQLNKALKTLNDSLILIQSMQNINNPEILLAVEDSIIKRFEYSYESFWKFLKKYIEFLHRLDDVNSPKKVFNACVKLGICTLQEGSTFIDMADSRNETSHMYSIEASRIILSSVPNYYSNMISVIKRLNTELNKF